MQKLLAKGCAGQRGRTSAVDLRANPMEWPGGGGGRHHRLAIPAAVMPPGYPGGGLLYSGGGPRTGL